MTTSTTGGVGTSRTKKIRRDEEAKRKRFNDLSTPTPKNGYEAAKKKWEDTLDVDKFIKETEDFLDKLNKKE